MHFISWVEGPQLSGPSEELGIEDLCFSIVLLCFFLIPNLVTRGAALFPKLLVLLVLII